MAVVVHCVAVVQRICQREASTLCHVRNMDDVYEAPMTAFRLTLISVPWLHIDFEQLHALQYILHEEQQQKKPTEIETKIAMR
jgi:hypothetical protein